MLKQRFLTDDSSEIKTARDLSFFRVGSYAGHDNILIVSSFYFIRNYTFLAAENRHFGRFVTTRYNVHCFLSFLGVFNEFF